MIAYCWSRMHARVCVCVCVWFVCVCVCVCTYGLKSGLPLFLLLLFWFVGFCFAVVDFFVCFVFVFDLFKECNCPLFNFWIACR